MGGPFRAHVRREANPGTNRPVRVGVEAVGCESCDRGRHQATHFEVVAFAGWVGEQVESWESQTERNWNEIE